MSILLGKVILLALLGVGLSFAQYFPPLGSGVAPFGGAIGGAANCSALNGVPYVTAAGVFTCDTLKISFNPSTGVLAIGPSVAINGTSGVVSSGSANGFITFQNGTLFQGKMYQPTATSASVAGNGTLSLGVHWWCVAAMTSQGNPGGGFGNNFGVGTCSSPVSATVTVQAVNGAQTIHWTGNSFAYFQQVAIYRSDDGGGAYFFIAAVSANNTTYTDSGDALTATPPSAVDYTYTLASSGEADNDYFAFETNGTIDLFFGANSCIQGNAPSQLLLKVGACDYLGASGLPGTSISMLPGSITLTGDVLLSRLIGNGASPSVAICGTIGTGSTNLAGFIDSATTGSCVSVVTFTATSPTGWSCAISNATTANLIRQTGSSATSATFTGMTVSGDVLRYACIAY